MSKFKVCVYAIAKDEEKFVERWYNSMKEADIVIVGDTGSNDATVSKLEELGVIVYKISINPWRFDAARNTVLNLIPSDVDICVSTDLDEVFEPGWRGHLESEWTSNLTRINFNYVWKFNEDGSPNVQFLREKIHSRKDYIWEHPVHEVLKYVGGNLERVLYNANVRLNHYPDDSKPRTQYLKLLEKSVHENPEDDRNIHYLGREYMYYEMWQECVDTLTKHLSIDKAWDREKSASARFISRAYKAMNKNQLAKKWLYRAISECQYCREAYVEFAQFAFESCDWETVIYMINQALKIKEPDLSYITEMSCWNHVPYDLKSIACYHLGMLNESLECAALAIDSNKDKDQTKRLENNFDLIMKKIQEEQNK